MSQAPINKHPINKSAINKDGFKITDSQIVFHGKVFSIAREKFLMPGGAEISRDVLMHKGSCAVVPLTKNCEIVLLKQYRGPLRDVILEIPAGVINPGEEPDETAVRELKEETGGSADKLIKLAEFYPTPGYSNELLHLYLGLNVELGEMALEEDEAIEITVKPFAEVLELIDRMEIQDAKTIIGAMLAHKYLSRLNK